MLGEVVMMCTLCSQNVTGVLVLIAPYIFIPNSCIMFFPMLRITSEEGYNVRHGDKTLQVLPAENGTIHVGEVTATEEAAVRFLDAHTRACFTHQPWSISVQLLNAPAGSGKTRSNIELAAHLTQSGQRVKMLAFSRNAQEDGQRRTQNENVVWQTIDSCVWQILPEQELQVDLSSATKVQEAVATVLGLTLSLTEVDQWRKDLDKACSTGDESRLGGTAAAMFEAGLRGRWWCFALLRVRALRSPELWTAAMVQFTTVIVDESQDLNPVMISLLLLLRPTHMLIFTRDCQQKIFGFNGCEDVASHLSAAGIEVTRWQLYLTFRHGRAVCDYLNEHQLSACTTFPADGLHETALTYAEPSYILPGQHMVLLKWWCDILRLADRYLNAGRAVRIDSQKRAYFLDAVDSPDHNSLFNTLARHRVRDIVSRTLVDDVSVPDTITLSTVHSSKGLEFGTVRIWSCVMNARTDEQLCVKYVAITRVQTHLVLPIPTAHGCKKRARCC